MEHLVVMCGHCSNFVEVPVSDGIAKCQNCGSYVARKGLPLDVARAFVEKAEGRTGGTLVDATAPLYPQTEPQFPKVGDQFSIYSRYVENPQFNNIKPSDITRDTRTRFSDGLELHTPAEFYATWAAYDAAVLNMPLPQQDLQRKAEIAELERLAAI